MNIWFLPDLLEGNGLFYLLIIVGVFPARGQLLKGFREHLALVISGTPHSFVQLEDWVAHLHT